MNESLKNKAIILRKQGYTFKEIKKTLDKDIPKSTLSYWCRNVQTPEFYNEKIRNINLEHLEIIRKAAVKANKKKQEILFESIRNNNEYLKNYLDKNTYKLLLSMLCLGEGSKYKSTRRLTFCSSSPEIIKLYLKLFTDSYNLKEEKFRVNILCRADQNIEELEKFWQDLTKIEKSRFYKTRVDKRTIGKKTLKKDYKGVCVIMYFDTKIQLELEILAEQIGCWV